MQLDVIARVAASSASRESTPCAGKLPRFNTARQRLKPPTGFLDDLLGRVIHRPSMSHHLKVSDFPEVGPPMVKIHEVLKPALPELIRLSRRHPILQHGHGRGQLADDERRRGHGSAELT